MKKLIAISAAAIGLAFLVGGCANLKEKSVVINTNGIGGKAGIVIDPSSGYPIPEVIGGEAGGAFVDHKIGDGDILVITEEKSLWSSEISSRSITFMGKFGGVSATIDKTTGMINIVGALSNSTASDSASSNGIVK